MNKRARILIVDDDPINVQLAEKSLCADYDIYKAYNGSDAIMKVKEIHPDLILLDVMMPDMTGFEVCRIIKAEGEYADIPILFLTAMGTIAGELMGLALGGLDYIVKPYDVDLLKLRVGNHIELKLRNNLIREQRDTLAQQKAELEAAHSRIGHLEGIIPICMYCKDIRRDDASWQQLEAYISEHSDALFSHGICPECMTVHYPDIPIVK